MQIRRRPPNPKVKVAHLEYAIPHEEGEPRNILEKIVWEKDREVAKARERMPLQQLKAKVAGLPPARDFLAALRGATTTPAVISRVRGRCQTLQLRVSSPIRGGYKLMARKGSMAQEVFVVTDLDAEQLRSVLQEHQP